MRLFAFHLVLAYLVDHVPESAALAVASAVSVGLVVSYGRLVAGLRLAVAEVRAPRSPTSRGSPTRYFLEGFTGRAVTGLCVATLFVVMQATGWVDWEGLLARPERPPAVSPRRPDRLANHALHPMAWEAGGGTVQAS